MYMQRLIPHKPINFWTCDVDIILCSTARRDGRSNFRLDDQRNQVTIRLDE
jgi:hypothetical protein